MCDVCVHSCICVQVVNASLFALLVKLLTFSLYLVSFKELRSFTKMFYMINKSDISHLHFF